MLPFFCVATVDKEQLSPICILLLALWLLAVSYHSYTCQDIFITVTWLLVTGKKCEICLDVVGVSIFLQFNGSRDQNSHFSASFLRLCFTFVCISQVVVSEANVSFAFPQLAYLLSQFQCFVCPVGFNSESNSFTVECEPSDIFVMQEYTLPTVLQNTLRWVRLCSCLSLGVIIITTLRDFRMKDICSTPPEMIRNVLQMLHYLVYFFNADN